MSEFVAEAFVEMMGIGDSDLECDLLHRHVSFAEQGCRKFHAPSADI